ncbi:MAG: zinc ribbon domain-containing protein YjdM [Candidatus Gracilibacteria bacterium]|jgi:protein PhnA
MSNEHKCPKCNSENTYQDVNLWVCLECYDEWDPSALAKPVEEKSQGTKVLDSNGNVLNNGDSVMVIKDLKAKGSSSGVKAGTKVKNIKLIENFDGHNISCKIDSMGEMYLKSEFVRKV